MDQQVEASNAYGKRPNKLLWTGGGHANPGKRSGNLAGRMKILITADLHYREHWFQWLLSRAADYHLLCIAGDLIEMFGSEPRKDQAREVSRWIRELEKVTRVAICSGNHDNAGRQISQDRAPVYEWLFALWREANVITDDTTQVVNDLIAAIVPYHCAKEQKSVWLDRGSSIRRQRRNQWLVLHQVPPRTYPGSTGEEAEAAELLSRSIDPEAKLNRKQYWKTWRWRSPAGRLSGEGRNSPRWGEVHPRS
jgi:hypothetical protein